MSLLTWTVEQLGGDAVTAAGAAAASYLWDRVKRKNQAATTVKLILHGDYEAFTSAMDNKREIIAGIIVRCIRQTMANATITSTHVEVERAQPKKRRRGTVLAHLESAVVELHGLTLEDGLATDDLIHTLKAQLSLQWTVNSSDITIGFVPGSVIVVCTMPYFAARLLALMAAEPRARR